MSDLIQIKIGDRILGTAPLDEAYIVFDGVVNPGREGDQFYIDIDDKTKEYSNFGYSTDLDTMALIFQNKTLRSSNLTNAKLNDPIEKKRVDVERFAGSKYITCFSHEGHESVPFWMYYGGDN